jgi:hypothetical protein
VGTSGPTYHDATLLVYCNISLLCPLKIIGVRSTAALATGHAYCDRMSGSRDLSVGG